jgi:hypothetical protein
MAESKIIISMINELRLRLFTLECEDEFDEERMFECNEIYSKIQKVEINALIDYLEEGEIVDVKGFIDLLNQFKELKSKWGKYSKFDMLVKTLYYKRDTSEAPLLVQKLIQECKRMFSKFGPTIEEEAIETIRTRVIELVTQGYEEWVACNDEKELDEERTKRFIEYNREIMENMVERIFEDHEREELIDEIFDKHKLEEYILNLFDQYINFEV